MQTSMWSYRIEGANGRWFDYSVVNVSATRPIKYEISQRDHSKVTFH